MTLEQSLLNQVDALVRQQRFPSRSRAIEAAIEEQIVGRRRPRLNEACAGLDPDEERDLAEEGLAEDVATWPEY